MKIFKLFFLVALVATFTACSDDDDAVVDTCTQADWVGTYTGTSNCDGTVEDATVEITASGTDAVIITVSTPDLESEYDPITFDACTLSETASEFGITLTVDAVLEDGAITFTEVFSTSDVSSTCTITVTKN